MNLIKKLALIGLSTLLTVTPCFAQTKIIAINDDVALVDTKMVEGYNFIQLKTLAEVAGYTIQFDNTQKIATISKGDKKLTLTLDDMGILNGRIYVPLARIITYFGDSIEVLGQAYEEFDVSDMMGDYYGTFFSMFLGIYSGTGEIYLDLEYDGIETRYMLKPIGDNRYEFIGESARLDFYIDLDEQGDEVFFADLYYQGELFDVLECNAYPGYWASITN